MFVSQKWFQTSIVTGLFEVIICLCCFSLVSAAVAPSSSRFLRETILTLHKARVNIVTKQLQEEEISRSGETERKDFQLFLSYLDGRIYYYCEELKKSDGEGALSGLPCPVAGGVLPETSGYGQLPEIPLQTERGRITELESDFTASLGEFDDMLLKEQEQIALNVPRKREGGNEGESGDGSGNGEKGSNGKGEKGQGAKGEVAKSGSSGQSGAKNGSKGGVQKAGSGGGSETRLPPTGGNRDLSRSDDDIVARQLKEAAEQETDPEVKARLWEEYRKYKGM